MVSALSVVRDRIARAILDGGPAPTGRPPDAPNTDVPHTLGRIVLRDAQRDAVRRLRLALAEFGGALLADEPGLGKTYVALALARDAAARGTLVVAPAALRSMWADAAERADTPVMFVSFESLSRSAFAAHAAFVIVDEAHHAANPAAQRYDRLARLCAGARTLLVSATPARNRRTEIDALLALVVGPRAATLSDAQRGRIIVKRTATAGDRPALVRVRARRSPGRLKLADEIASLPPPLPVVDGLSAAPLVQVGLARCWASSLAALAGALRRREQRGRAMLDALAIGALPSRAELRHWALGDDATQLAFPELVATTVVEPAALRHVLHAHLDALRALQDRASPTVHADTRARADWLRDIRARHPGAIVIAFTGFAATAESLWHELRNDTGVALLTGRHARTASGPRARDDVLRALGGDVARAVSDRITLVVATDVLSEGVNLQGASVIVHLDQPWTPAALEQRAGRAARIGSHHARVVEYTMRPPRDATSLLRLDDRMARKRTVQRRATEDAVATERLRSLVRGWRARENPPSPSECPQSASGGQGAAAPTDAAALAVAVTAAARGGWLAVLSNGRREWLTSSRGSAPRALLAMVRAASGAARPLTVAAQRAAVTAVQRAIARETARGLAGDGSSRARRTLLHRAHVVCAHAAFADQAAAAAELRDLRIALDAVAGAGGEAEIAVLCHRAVHDTGGWLRQCTARLRELTRPGHPERNEGADTRPRLVALLILESDRRPALSPASGPRSQPSRQSAPPATST